MVSRLDFYAQGFLTNPATANYSLQMTNRQGVFFVGQTDRIRNDYFPILTLTDDRPIYSIFAVGVDQVSSLVVSAEAPIGATVVSPLNTVIRQVGDQALVKRALRMDSGSLFRLLNDPDPRTFSASQNFASADSEAKTNAERVSASNVRLLVLMAAIDVYGLGGGRDGEITTMPFLVEQTRVADFIRANPSQLLYSQAGTEALFRSITIVGGAQPYRDDVIAAFANLTNQYAVAVGTILNDDGLRARYMLGIQGWLLPRLIELRRDNSAAAAATAMALSVVDAQNGTAIFNTAPPPQVTSGRYFSVPDFFRVAPDATRVLPNRDVNSNGSPALSGFDIYFQNSGPFGTNGQVTIVSVTLPSENAAAISINLRADEGVDITARAGFTGVSWFD